MACILSLILFASVALAQALPQQAEQSLDGTWTFHSAEGTAREVQLPCGFEDHEGPAFDGSGRYERVLPPLVLEGGWRWLLHCDAVATHCTVRVNGMEVARHTGGWTPFRADLTLALHEDPTARNTLALEIKEAPGHTTQGFMPIIAPHFGGPWQPVRLLRVPATTLDEPALHVLADAVSHTITVHATLDGAEPERGLQFRVRVLDQEGHQVSSAATLVASALADASGRWLVNLHPPKDEGPHTITLRGTTEVILKDVLSGEVWICGGQSNMEWSMGPHVGKGILNYQAELATVKHPRIRLISVPKVAAATPQARFEGQWQSADGPHVARWSAVAWFFARDLQAVIGRPIGLISTCWGAPRQRPGPARRRCARMAASTYHSAPSTLRNP